MDSRIILTKADFSANNIGRYVEISDLAKKVLSKQTQYDVESEEAIALNSFLNNLIADGFIGGDSPLLTSLFIPALANSHDELLYNIASLDENGYPVNGMSADEISASQKAYSVYEKDGKNIALCRFASQGDPTISEIDNRLRINTKLISEAGAYPSLSIAFYCLKTTGNLNYFIRNASSSGVIRIGKNSNVGITYANEDVIAASIENSTLLGFNAVSYLKDTSWEGIGDHITVGNTTIGDLTKSITGADTEKASCFNIGDFVYGTTCVLPFLATGHYMDTTKLGQLRTYVNTLLTALHATTL